MKEAILILEDDKKLNDGIRLALRDDKYDFIQCRTIESAREELQSRKTALILLDINLPDGSGMEFLEELRNKASGCNSDAPIIIITANKMEADIVTGLELGANDYITKPFSLMVLRARVNVWLRQNKHTGKEHFVTEIFDFDFDRMIFKRAGQELELSKTEQRILKKLIENRGATLKREYLIDAVWSGDTEYVDEHALTVAVKRLRDKIEADGSEPEYIKTVYGLGYTWKL